MTMTKSKWNFLIDVNMLLFMGIITGIGFLIKYTLIPGSERWDVYGRNVDLSFMGLDRHQWGEIHLILGFILLGLLILHIILHWKAVKCLYKKYILSKNVRVFCASAFTIITLLFVVIPFIVPIEVTERISENEHRHSIAEREKMQTEMYNSLETKIDRKAETLVQKIKKNESEHHHKVDPSIEVKSYMILQEVSNNYDVPCDYLKANLNIPKSRTNNIRLGQLRKQYNFKMSDLELIISNYKNENK
jgi:uncharacterized protein DUF4405